MNTAGTLQVGGDRTAQCTWKGSLLFRKFSVFKFFSTQNWCINFSPKKFVSLAVGPIVLARTLAFSGTVSWYFVFCSDHFSFNVLKNWFFLVKKTWKN